ncbi:hypothetical protein Tco_1442384, partial [Tanacetum coccineum]
MILQDTLQVSLAEHKSREEQEARENVELVNKHLASEEIEKNDEPQIPGTRLEPRSDKESPEVERTNDEEVEVTNVVISVNVNEVVNEIIDEVYELKRREKGKIIEESRSTPLPTPIRSPRTHTNLVSSDTEKLQELTETHTQTTSSSRSQHTKLSRTNRLLSLFKAKPARLMISLLMVGVIFANAADDDLSIREAAKLCVLMCQWCLFLNDESLKMVASIQRLPNVSSRHPNMDLAVGDFGGTGLFALWVCCERMRIWIGVGKGRWIRNVK